MKLKTTQNGSHDLIDATDENLIHDAMAAHALMRAMEEWWERPAKDDSCTDAAVTWIECRAAELMREWTEGVG